MVDIFPTPPIICVNYMKLFYEVKGKFIHILFLKNYG